MNFKIAILFMSFVVAVALAEEPASKANPNSPECAKAFKSTFLGMLKKMPKWNDVEVILRSEFDTAFSDALYALKGDYKGCTFPYQWRQQCRPF